jgi:hypothetical protein
MDKATTIAAQAKAQKADDKANTIKGKTKEQLAKEVKSLLVALRATVDANEKKGIRRKLRARGHFGGLGDRNIKTSKKGDKKASKKGKRTREKKASVVQTPPTPEIVAHAA